MKKLVSIVCMVAMLFSTIAFTTTVKASYFREYETIGNGNGWQYMTINDNATGDGPLETFKIEGGTSWDDLPEFTIYNYPISPNLTFIDPTDPMQAGRYNQMMLAWKIMAYHFKSPVYTVQTTGTHTVTWNAEHNLSVDNPTTRYYIQLVDANTGEILYSNPKCVNCDGCANCRQTHTYMQTYEHAPDYTCSDCECEGCDGHRFNYFGLYINGEDQKITFDVDLEAGQEVQILYVRNNGSQMTVKEASITEKKEPHVVTIGEDEYPVDDGDDFTLPEGPEYGYLIDGELYHPEEVIEVTKDIEAIPINTINVSVLNGAAIKKAPPAGIAFHGLLETNEELLNSSAYTAGMLITPYELYRDAGDEKLSLDSNYKFINVINENGWLKNQLGSFRAGVINIPEKNYTMQYIARAYMTLNYKRGDSRTIYSGMSDVRSIKQVAQLAVEMNSEDANEYVRQIAAYEN